MGMLEYYLVNLNIDQTEKGHLLTFKLVLP